MCCHVGHIRKCLGSAHIFPSLRRKATRLEAYSKNLNKVRVRELVALSSSTMLSSRHLLFMWGRVKEREEKANERFGTRKNIKTTEISILGSFITLFFPPLAWYTSKMPIEGFELPLDRRRGWKIYMKCWMLKHKMWNVPGERVPR